MLPFDMIPARHPGMPDVPTSSKAVASAWMAVIVVPAAATACNPPRANGPALTGPAVPRRLLRTFIPRNRSAEQEASAAIIAVSPNAVNAWFTPALSQVTTW